MSNEGRQFAHAMLREIYEQPDAIAQTLDAYAENGCLREDVFEAARAALVGRESVLISASGSSRHAGLVGEILLEDLAGMTVDVEYASEYIYRSTHTLKNPCFLVLSQSGETADTLEALREAGARGMSTMAITNKPESTMAKLAGCSLPTHAGVEKAVPATKSFTTQLVVLSLLALYAARIRGRMTRAVVESYVGMVDAVPSAMAFALPMWEQQVAEVAASLQTAESFLFLGRGAHYAIAREGALKLKESAYIHAEGYPSGELKHGPNALVSASTPLLVLATRDPHSPDSMLRYEKTVNLLKDMYKQDAAIVSVVTEGDSEVVALSRHTITVPAAPEFSSPLCEVVPLQLLAYFMAVGRGIDVDHPRNLVKAVVRE